MRTCAVALTTLSLLFVACKSENKQPPKPPSTPSAKPSEPVARPPTEPVTPAVPSDKPPVDLTPTPQGGEGTITGVITWGSPDFKRKTLDVNGDPKCVQIRSAMGPLLSEKLIAENGVIENCFIYIKSGLPDRTWPVPADQVLLDQKGCHYEPHVFGVRAGQEILIRNSDTTAHNIHAVPQNNAEFNKGQPKQGMTFVEKFDNAEIGLKIKCDVHPWMSAYCHVMDHPFFAVSDADGKFTIANVPAGTYVISTWLEHSGLKPKTQEITVKDGETTEIEIKFKKP